MKPRGPIRYQSLDEGERPTASRLANVIAINQVIADPDEAAATYGMPQWYIIRAQPGQERIAAAHLAGRRFGVYVPVFAGYIFAWCRDIASDNSRIRACPMVIDLLRHSSGAAAFVTWDMIDWLRKQEDFWYSADVEAPTYTPQVRNRRKPRRSKKIRRSKERAWKKSLAVNEAQGVHA